MLLAALAACGSGEITAGREHQHFDLTLEVPEMDSLLLPDGSSTADPEEIRHILTEWADRRVSEWLDSHPECDRGELTAVAEAQYIIIVDGACALVLQGKCLRGYYTGSVIAVAIYAVDPDADFPTHYPTDGYGLKYLPHELDHAVKLVPDAA